MKTTRDQKRRISGTSSVMEQAHPAQDRGAMFCVPMHVTFLEAFHETPTLHLSYDRCLCCNPDLCSLSPTEAVHPLRFAPGHVVLVNACPCAIVMAQWYHGTAFIVQLRGSQICLDIFCVHLTEIVCRAVNNVVHTCAPPNEHMVLGETPARKSASLSR